MSLKEPSNHDATESEERIVQSIYDHVVTTVCIDIASNMHGLIKTGEIPMSELKEPFSRQDIFPELYKDKDPAEIQETLDKYATVVAPRTRKRKFPQQMVEKSTEKNDDDDDDDDDDEDFKVDEPTATPAIQTRNTPNKLDIWGKIALKEPKENCQCQICGRFVSTSRFAPHLDKCMGLSTARPASGSNHRSN